MSLSIGIIGLPNVGKSTLFNTLTSADVLAANYPFATIEPNSGIVPVPDKRLGVLKKIYSSEKIIPATVNFVDIAGLVAGASTGEGLGNKFLANIRECDAIVHVVRAFENDAVLRHDGSSVSPKNDIEIINTELILADIQTIEKQLPKLAKEAKSSKNARQTLDYLQVLLEKLKTGQTLTSMPDLDQQKIANLHLLTAKPTIFVFNVSEEQVSNQKFQDELNQLASPNQAIFISAKLEEELKGLDESDANELLASYDIQEPALDQLIASAYKTLGLQSYLTAGPKEVRAWTIKKAATAPQAAGVIHTDFEKGFIAAQVIDYNDLVQTGSELKAKEAGLIRTEGKDYVMRPNDVIEFRFNV